MSEMAAALDQAATREAFGAFPSGVAAIAADVDGVPQVIVVSSFVTGVSLEPPLVMFAVKNDSSTWPTLTIAERLGVTVLAAGHQDVVRQLASKRRETRLDGVSWLALPSGAIVFEPAPVWFESVIEQTHPAGDHTIVVLRITEICIDHSEVPLVWHGSGFHVVLSPSQPKDNAIIDEKLWHLLEDAEWR